jgi:hypothetical protein
MIPCRAIVPALLTRMLQPAERGQRRRDDLLPALLACDVLHPEQRLAALLRQPFREALADSRIDIGKDDCGAFAHEQFGFRRPLPSRGSGNQRDFVRQPGHRVPPFHLLSLRWAKRRSNPRSVEAQSARDCFASLAMTDGG